MLLCLNICYTEMLHNRVQTIQGIILDVYFEVKYWVALELSNQPPAGYCGLLNLRI